jgi:hypothetical protein
LDEWSASQSNGAICNFAVSEVPLVHSELATSGAWASLAPFQRPHQIYLDIVNKPLRVFIRQTKSCGHGMSVTWNCNDDLRSGQISEAPTTTTTPAAPLAEWNP